jgi:hypothetical protein
MKEIEQEDSRSIYIAAYWPSRQADEPPIGYGMDSRRKIDFVFMQGLSILAILLRILTDLPKVRLLIYRREGCLLYLTITLGFGILFIRKNIQEKKGYRKIGYYQLDNEGKPILFLSPLAPIHIWRRIGVDHKRFLERMNQNK